MKIVQITPGAGRDYYCENCLRDAALARAMRQAGHDVVVVPLYLPIAAEKTGSVPRTAIFFGGINVYLQQKFALFRRTPRWMDRIFDTKPLLRWAARKAAMTSAPNQGQTMLSMLRGADGRQAKELKRLVSFLAAGRAPQVICLSNALLAGLAQKIKAELHRPVVCLLQDEDGFLDALDEPLRSRCWAELARRAADIDAFVAVSAYYGDVMRRRLRLPEQRLHVVHTGLETSLYSPAEQHPELPVIGFLSPICQAKGFDTLVEAFIELKRNEGLRPLRLRAAGGRPAGSAEFFDAVNARLTTAGLRGDVEYAATPDGPGRAGFLRSLSVLSVPTRRPEAYGLFVLEALACGVPVVMPAHGAYPELIEATEGGLLFKPNDAGDLTRRLAALLGDEEHRRELGRRGREAVMRDFDIRGVAQKVAAIYDKVISEAGP